MFSLARELHTPVSLLLANMTQKELVRWIAYFKLQNTSHEETELPKSEKPQTEKATAKVMVKKPSQKQKDDLLLQQLFAIVGNGKKRKG